MVAPLGGHLMSCSRLHTFGILCDVCERLQDARDAGILTVGELRRLLVGLDDETQVLIAPLGYAEYLNINDAILPDEENTALILFGADTYDSRQF